VLTLQLLVVAQPQYGVQLAQQRVGAEVPRRHRVKRACDALGVRQFQSIEVGLRGDPLWPRQRRRRRRPRCPTAGQQRVRPPAVADVVRRPHGG
jgi:hypothetical protein